MRDSFDRTTGRAASAVFGRPEAAPRAWMPFPMAAGMEERVANDHQRCQPGRPAPPPRGSAVPALPLGLTLAEVPRHAYPPRQSRCGGAQMTATIVSPRLMRIGGGSVGQIA